MDCWRVLVGFLSGSCQVLVGVVDGLLLGSCGVLVGVDDRL